MTSEFKYPFTVYYTKKNLRFYELACTYENDQGQVVVELNPKFLIKEKLWGIDISEILMHEAVHFYRNNLQSDKYEESIAYMLSKSKLRKFFGGIFKNTKESYLFFIASSLMPIIPMLTEYWYLYLLGFITSFLIKGFNAYRIYRRLKILIDKLNILYPKKGFCCLILLSDIEIDSLWNRSLAEIKKEINMKDMNQLEEIQFSSC